MRVPGTNCPECNSLQRFARHERTGPAGTIESYIRCLECEYEQVIDVETPAQRRARRREWVHQLRAMRRTTRR